MSLKYFCEFCGQKFHNHLAASECSRTPVCRGMGFPPKEVESAWKVRGCAIILATTAADMVLKSPAGQSIKKLQTLAGNIKKWSRRAEEALCANTPLSLGKRARLHNGLVDFVWNDIWPKGAAIPNIHVLDLAQRYALDASIYIKDRIEDGLDKKFWFEDKHAEWLFYPAINMPLATYITCMKNRRVVTKELDSAIIKWEESKKLEFVEEDEENGGPARFLELMLEHCWRDELRSWNFLIGALGTTIKHIEEHGSIKSLDLTNFDTYEVYIKLLDYIWDDKKEPTATSKLKLWLVNDRFWVAAENKAQAKEVLVRDTGHVPRDVKGVDLNKKLHALDGTSETAGEMLSRYKEPQFIGVA